MSQVLMQSLAEEKNVISSEYGMFIYSIRNEFTRKYYERRLKKFFDYIGFDVQSDLETRCNLFAKRGVIDGKWALDQIISFLQFEKGANTEGRNSRSNSQEFRKGNQTFLRHPMLMFPGRKLREGFRELEPQLMTEHLQ
jgi:hypothetical protein